MTLTTHDFVDKFYFTIEDYHRMGEVGIIPEDQRVELIHGEIIKMSPINSPHAGTVKSLIRMIVARLGNQFTLSIQDPLTIHPNSEPEPDLALLVNHKDNYTSVHPTPSDVVLLIEVADTSLQKDREIKLPLYASAGIKEVWIVNLEDRQIEISTSPTSNSYSNLHIYHPGDTIQHELLGRIEIEEILIIAQ